MRVFIFLWLLLSCQFSDASQSLDPYGIEEILSHKDPRVSVVVEWVSHDEDGLCDDDAVNAYYDSTTKKIGMCTGLILKAPQLIPGMFAHELGHATVHQLNLPYTGSPEVAADEFSAWLLISTGRGNDIRQIARYFTAQDHDVPFYDPHPDDDTRGYVLECYRWGEEVQKVFPNMHCAYEWRRISSTWPWLIEHARL